MALTQTQLEAHVAVFATEVIRQSRSIDPENTQDWYSLALGWAIAKGLTPENAHEFSLWMRYRLNQ